MLKIAVLSGKGGTGKTFVSVNLASVIDDVTYIDCDIEEPNGRLFLKPDNVAEKVVTVKKPVIDHDLCVGCRKCVKFCEFNALAYVGNKIMVFDELCHSCSGCAYTCPQLAITEEDRKVGSLEIGNKGNVRCVTGILDVSVAAGIPIITAALNEATENTVIDCPPGSSCEVIESVSDADYCLIVVEPNRFSYHNYLMIKELLDTTGKEYGVIINKYNPETEIEFNDNVIAKIDYSKEISEQLAIGKIPVKKDQKLKKIFQDIYQKVLEEVNHD